MDFLNFSCAALSQIISEHGRSPRKSSCWLSTRPALTMLSSCTEVTSSPSIFFRLPLEIREMIYALVLERSAVTPWEGWEESATVQKHLRHINKSLFTASEAIYAESYPIAFTCNAFWWPPWHEISRVTPTSLRFRLDTIRTVILPYTFLNSVARLHGLHRILLPDLMIQYLPARLKHLVVWASEYQVGYPLEYDTEDGAPNRKLLSDHSTRWINLLLELGQIITIDTIIVRPTEREPLDDSLDEIFPDCVLRAKPEQRRRFRDLFRRTVHTIKLAFKSNRV